jgi:hypothetical protein
VPPVIECLRAEQVSYDATFPRVGTIQWPKFAPVVLET